MYKVALVVVALLAPAGAWGDDSDGRSMKAYGVDAMNALRTSLGMPPAVDAATSRRAALLNRALAAERAAGFSNEEIEVVPSARSALISETETVRKPRGHKSLSHHAPPRPGKAEKLKKMDHHSKKHEAMLAARVEQLEDELHKARAKEAEREARETVIESELSVLRQRAQSSEVSLQGLTANPIPTSEKLQAMVDAAEQKDFQDLKAELAAEKAAREAQSAELKQLVAQMTAQAADKAEAALKESASGDDLEALHAKLESLAAKNAAEKQALKTALKAEMKRARKHEKQLEDDAVEQESFLNEQMRSVLGSVRTLGSTLRAQTDAVDSAVAEQRAAVKARLMEHRDHTSSGRARSRHAHEHSKQRKHHKKAKKTKKTKKKGKKTHVKHANVAEEVLLQVEDRVHAHSEKRAKKIDPNVIMQHTTGFSDGNLVSKKKAAEKAALAAAEIAKQEAEKKKAKEARDAEESSKVVMKVEQAKAAAKRAQKQKEAALKEEAEKSAAKVVEEGQKKAEAKKIRQAKMTKMIAEAIDPDDAYGQGTGRRTFGAPQEAKQEAPSKGDSAPSTLGSPVSSLKKQDAGKNATSKPPAPHLVVDKKAHATGVLKAVSGHTDHKAKHSAPQHSAAAGPKYHGPKKVVKDVFGLALLEEKMEPHMHTRHHHQLPRHAHKHADPTLKLWESHELQPDSRRVAI